MKLIKIKSLKQEEFKEIWKIYEESFPKDERRDLEAQKQVLKNKLYRLYSINDKNEVIGLIGEWKLPKIYFLEHIAIRKDKRNEGIGSKIIPEYLEKRKQIILETERPEANEMAIRRIKFWKRQGLILNNFDYIQPPYGLDKLPVPLYLMTYPNKLKLEELRKIRDNIHKTVYVTNPITGKNK